MLLRCDAFGDHRGRAWIQVSHRFRKGCKCLGTVQIRNSLSLVASTSTCGMPARITTRGTPHSPKGSLVQEVILQKKKKNGIVTSLGQGAPSFRKRSSQTVLPLSCHASPKPVVVKGVRRQLFSPLDRQQLCLDMR